MRHNPRPGLITELAKIENDGDRLNEEELLSMVFLLLVAGHETTVHLISNAILTFFQHPRELERLRADWELLPNAIEEVLRYTSPVQLAKPRYVARDMEYRGQQLRRGELLTPLLACANYDPAKFEDPLTFNMHRDPNYHMTFGSGPHVCLGMKLARSETECALKTIFSRWPNLEPQFDVGNPDWSMRIGMRGLKSLKVKFR